MHKNRGRISGCGGMQRCLACVLGGIVALSSPGRTPAADGPVTQPARGTVNDPLAAKEQLVRDRMTQLEDRMYRLSEKLMRTEPSQARRLEVALRQARELLIRRNMEEAMALLETGKLTDAADRQADIIRDLEKLLKILMEEAENNEERKKQIDQLEAFREQIRELLEQERQLKSHAQAAPRLEQLMASIRAAIARLEAMIQRQQQTLGQTQGAQAAKDPTTAAALAEKQKQLRLEAEAFSQNLNPPGATPPGAGSPAPGDPQASPPSGQPPQGAPNPTEPQTTPPGAGAPNRTEPQTTPPGAGAPSSGQPSAGSDSQSGSSRPADAPQPPAAPQPAPNRPEPPGHDGHDHEGHDHEGHDPESHEAPAQPNAQTQPADDAAAAPEAPIEAGLRRAGGSVQKASEQMKAAESALERHQLDPAVPAQKEAIESLQNALAELKKQEEEARKLLDQAQAARKQRELKQLTDKLAQRMASPDDKQSGEPPPEGNPSDSQKPGTPGGQGDPNQQQQQNGEQGGSQKPGQSGDDQQQQQEQQQQPAPGAKNVQQAGEQMQQAAEKLDKENPHEAAENQQKSIEELEKAQQELEDALEQLRREQQEEILRGLESRFRAMLAQQLIINRGADELNNKGMPAWTHADELTLAGLARDELKLADDAGAALHILREDGTSIVFPRIVEQLQSDIRELSRLLGSKTTGEPAQALESAIVATLEELIDAIKQMREELQQGGGGGGGGGGQQQTPPLLPDSAELKLLRSCQERINKQTAAYESKHGSERTQEPELRRHLERLADRQRDVADMARKMNERATGQ